MIISDHDHMIVQFPSTVILELKTAEMYFYNQFSFVSIVILAILPDFCHKAASQNLHIALDA